MDFHESMLITHIVMLVIFVIVIITLFLDLLLYHNEEIKTYAVSAGILFLFGIIEYIFYSMRIEQPMGRVFQYGFLIFSILLALRTLKKTTEMIKLSASARHYKSLATRDYLSGCRNRAAYSHDLSMIKPGQSVAIVMADINHMKLINDNYGHLAGDEVIMRCGQCLIEVFGSKRCYRIGGDEFLCLIEDITTEEAEKKVEDFQQACQKSSLESSYQFEVAVGYAIYDSAIDKGINDTVKRADQHMYNVKGRAK